MDLERVLPLAVTALSGRPAADWDRPAGPVEWTCRETAEHLADDLFGFAAQLSPPVPPLDGYVPFRVEPLRDGGPASAIWADAAAGPDGLLQIVEATGGLLTAVLRTRGPEVRAFHWTGVTDPSGYEALALVETLVHVDDIATGLGVTWDPPADVCARVLARLFPDVEAAPEGPWATLLWACGRRELAGRPRRGEWAPDVGVRP
ncbi:MAG TPA: maleylpyruvate isomerase N-terminal domain-containing protein [Phytomonospora sp.]